jgi:hypothetical protein
MAFMLLPLHKNWRQAEHSGHFLSLSHFPVKCFFLKHLFSDICNLHFFTKEASTWQFDGSLSPVTCMHCANAILNCDTGVASRGLPFDSSGQISVEPESFKLFH